MYSLETERLRLRPLTPGDAAFIMELLNDPDWKRFIGDRNIRTLDDARGYIEKGPMTMYAKHNVGSLLVEVKTTGEPAGFSGLIKRDGLDDVDIGFAFLPRFRGFGYAYESTAAVLDHGRKVLGFPRIVAINSKDNEDSARLLERLGLRFEKFVTMPNATEELRLYAL